MDVYTPIPLQVKVPIRLGRDYDKYALLADADTFDLTNRSWRVVIGAKIADLQTHSAMLTPLNSSTDAQLVVGFHVEEDEPLGDKLITMVGTNTTDASDELRYCCQVSDLVKPAI